MRTFAARGSYALPLAWLDLLDVRPHIRHADVVIAAPLKAAAAARLAELGARHVDLRVAMGTDTERLTAAGLIVPGRAIVYEHAVDTRPILAVDDDGPRLIARWRYDRRGTREMLIDLVGPA